MFNYLLDMNYSDKLLKNLRDQMRLGVHCDIQIQVEEKIFNGHKCILAATSSCLRSHIEKADKAFIKSGTTQPSQIKLAGISKMGFNAVFEYMYSGEVEINNETVDVISNVAMVLDIADLITKCADYKRKQLVVTSYSTSSPKLGLTQAASPVVVNVGDEEVSETSNNDSNYDGESETAEPQLKFMDLTTPHTPEPQSDQDNQLEVATTSKLNPENVSSFVQSFEAMDKDPSALPTLLPIRTSMLTENQDWSQTNLANLGNFNQFNTFKPNKNQIGEEVDKQGNLTWRCLICNKLFHKLSYLKYVHIRLHDGVRPHTCAMCGKTFATKGNLLQHHKSHMARNGILPFKCRYCKKGFSLKGNCMKHEKTHTKPFRCEFCLKSFTLKPLLLQHIAKMHENVADQSTVGSQCSKCHKVFSEAFGDEYLSHKCGVFLTLEPDVEQKVTSSLSICSLPSV